jgi:N6-adenosine-specific RNA methylase IME4
MTSISEARPCDRMFPGVRKIELFNRGGLDRDGWKTWGNQVEGER